jgi:hypothetical protein
MADSTQTITNAVKDAAPGVTGIVLDFLPVLVEILSKFS